MSGLKPFNDYTDVLNTFRYNKKILNKEKSIKIIIKKFFEHDLNKSCCLGLNNYSDIHHKIILLIRSLFLQYIKIFV